MPAKHDLKYIALEFVEKINEQDVDGICDLMSDDFIFVDSMGGSMYGRDAMKQAWRDYFAMFPDYEISITHILQQENIIAILGTAKGTYAVRGKLHQDNSWEVRAAWKAKVEDDQVKEWHVYADLEPVRQIVAHYSE